MSNYNKRFRNRQIINFSELRTQEAEDEDSRRGLALTGNTLLGETHAHAPLRPREETPVGCIEIQFAKQSLDIRVEALDLETKMISISATRYDEYLIARQELKKGGWDVKFDRKRIPKAEGSK
jgi:hypothetical protein